MTDNSAALKRARAADSQARLARCESVLRRMVSAGEPVSVAEVVRRAKVGEKFPYRHPLLKARIDEAKRAATAATAPDLDRALAVERDYWKEQTRHLQRRLDEAIRRIAEIEGLNVAQERGLVPPDREETGLRDRMRELEATVDDLKTRAGEAERDLDAARKLNRDLVRDNSRLQGSQSTSPM